MDSTRSWDGANRSGYDWAAFGFDISVISYFFQGLGFGMNNGNSASGKRNPSPQSLDDVHQSSIMETTEENAERDVLLCSVESRDLMDFGMIPEFVGMPYRI